MVGLIRVNPHGFLASAGIPTAVYCSLKLPLVFPLLKGKAENFFSP